MKKLICILILFVFAFLLIGCHSELDNRFQMIYKDTSFGILQDKNTGVCYLWANPNSSVGGITAILNEDGTPVTEWEIKDG